MRNSRPALAAAVLCLAAVSCAWPGTGGTTARDSRFRAILRTASLQTVETSSLRLPIPGELSKSGGLFVSNGKPVPGFRWAFRSEKGYELWRANAAGILRCGWAGFAVLLTVPLLAPVRLFCHLSRRRRSERLLKLRSDALAQCREGVVIVGFSGDIEYANRAFAGMHGCAPEEMEGSHFSQYLTEEQLRKEIPAWMAAVATSDFHQAPLRYRRRDGTSFSTVTSVSVIRDKEGTRVALLGVVHDSSREEHLEAQLRHAQKMEALGRLAGGVAHDFNNLLTVIIGYSQMASYALGPEHPLAKPLREIGKAGERAADLTRQMLTLSRKQVLVPVVLDLNRLVEQSERMLRRVIGSDIEIVTRFDPSLWPVKADAGQVHQVILNLAVNARDAMPRGGRLTFETACFTVDEDGPVELSPGEYARLSVTDTGEGMDEEVLSRVFEPFFTTKAEGLGTGLGLPIVYGIVRQSGGAVAVSSEPGNGSTFHVYLPRTREYTPGESVVRRVPVRGRGNILVVESRDDVRAITATLLRSYGYRVLEAAGAAEAESVCRRTSEPIHLLLADLELPRGEAEGLADRIAALHPGVRKLYMSGGAAHDIATRLRAPESSILAKPFSPQTLAERVAAALT